MPKPTLEKKQKQNRNWSLSDLKHSEKFMGRQIQKGKEIANSSRSWLREQASYLQGCRMAAPAAGPSREPQQPFTVGLLCATGKGWFSQLNLKRTFLGRREAGQGWVDCIFVVFHMKPSPSWNLLCDNTLVGIYCCVSLNPLAVQAHKWILLQSIEHKTGSLQAEDKWWYRGYRNSLLCFLLNFAVNLKLSEASTWLANAQALEPSPAAPKNESKLN